MKKLIVLLTIWAAFAGLPAYGEPQNKAYTLSEAVEHALRNNPLLAASRMDIEIENYGIDEAKGGRLPRVNLIGSAIRSGHDLPVLPISGSPLEEGFPEFSNPIYRIGVSFSLPLYSGGRFSRQVNIAKTSRSIAAEALAFERQELVFNVTSIYCKILELEKVLEASRKRVSQLETHKKVVELFLEAGNVPRVDLLNTETGLAHARHSALIVKHNLESAYELLKSFMGIEDGEISLVPEVMNRTYPAPRESMERAFTLRADYRAVLKKEAMAYELVQLQAGKRLPSLNLHGEYSENSGKGLDFEEDWSLSLRLTMPIFDGGVIKTRINRARKERERIKEEERALRLEIIREIKDARLGISNARERIEVSSKGIETAEEILRIERLKYEAGAGTSTDVIDAQTALLRARVEYYRAVYDKDIAIAALDKAIGLDRYKEGSE